MKVPLATYRLQFCPDFGFGEAGKILDYLTRLGISDIYASPIFRARKGSTHGYDIVDMTALNGELGSVEEFRLLAAEAASRGLGWIQDIVPNHMAFDPDNWMLMDVLESGPRSQYAVHFDIDWEHPYESIRGRLLAPFLGDLFSAVIDRGEISLSYGEEGFRFAYFGTDFPLSIESYTDLLTRGIDRLRAKHGEDSPSLIKYLGILYNLRGLSDLPAGEERQNQVHFTKRVLWELYSRGGEVGAHIDRMVRDCNEEESRQLLVQILSRQWFRLSFWKVATEEINYRRFFNINGLISLRMERAQTFEDTHALVSRFLAEGLFTGLRVDHIDGLTDPEEYLARLRRAAGDAYLAVEKILGRGERLPRSWPVQGTTGYEFLNVLNGLFCETRNGRSFNRIYYAFTGMKSSFDAMAYEKKKMIIEKHMGGDVDNLTLLLKGVSSRDRYGIDMTRQGLRRALVEIMASFHVYRTYVSAAGISTQDRRAVKEAVERGRRRNPALLHEMNFIERFLLLESEQAPTADREEAVAFVRRFQQFTGPLMAKGFEDTLFYSYNRLLSLNEVGGSPDCFGGGLEDFHRFNRRRRRLSPHTMSATGTHDTKRGEDARARINVLSEMPRQWEKALKRWHRANRRFKRISHGREMPDRNDEYMLYQAMAGSWPLDEAEVPLFAERLRAYAVKAVREAKVHTAWLKPDSEYEEAFLAFLDALLAPGADNDFLPDFISFQKKVSRGGICNSLAQTVVKITAPGVPDFYQGAELWDFSLVDPDNRRPVDFEVRSRFLEEICRREKGDLRGLARELADSPGDGRVKLFLIHRALRMRREEPEIFQEGEYLPLPASGSLARNVISFARRAGERWALTAVPRLLSSADEGGDPRDGERWGDTKIEMPPEAPEKWRDVFTGQEFEIRGSLAVGCLFSDFPVSLLVSGQGGSSRH